MLAQRILVLQRGYAVKEPRDDGHAAAFGDVRHDERDAWVGSFGHVGRGRGPWVAREAAGSSFRVVLPSQVYHGGAGLGPFDLVLFEGALTARDAISLRLVPRFGLPRGPGTVQSSCRRIGPAGGSPHPVRQHVRGRVSPYRPPVRPVA